jgi:hypothetical protein
MRDVIAMSVPRMVLLTASALLVSGSMCRDVFDPPRIPARPDGPAHVMINDTANYTTVTTDRAGRHILYVFDWGDGKTTTIGMLESGDTAVGRHAWDSIATYTIRVKAKNDGGKWTYDWSDTLNVTVDSLFHLAPALSRRAASHEQ